MSIYDEIGGRDAVAAAVDIFYDKVLGDDVLAPYFIATDMGRQKTHMRAFLAAAIGGPAIYAGRDMGAAHRGLGVTDEAFDHVVEHLVATLTELSVPAQTIGAIGAKLLPLRAIVVERAAIAA
jgi:hemoglobin